MKKAMYSGMGTVSFAGLTFTNAVFEVFEEGKELELRMEETLHCKLKFTRDGGLSLGNPDEQSLAE